jgi:hypothetical protein
MTMFGKYIMQEDRSGYSIEWAPCSLDTCSQPDSPGPLLVSLKISRQIESMYVNIFSICTRISEPAKQDALRIACGRDEAGGRL